MSTKGLLRLILLAVLLSASAFAVDGVVLINQATVMVAGGFPYKITQPGSYKLSGNLVVPVDTDGIDISANGVSLDLNGFTIGTAGTGVCDGDANSETTTTCTGTFSKDGISAMSDGVSVRNGSVTGMVFGIELMGSGSLVEEVLAFRNSTEGIFVEQGIVRRSASNHNGGDGIQAFSFGSVIVDCIAVGNRLVGIGAVGATVMQNSATFNGIHGLEIGEAVWGGNVLFFNGSGPVLAGTDSVSQGNNNCSGTSC